MHLLGKVTLQRDTDRHVADGKCGVSVCVCVHVCVCALRVALSLKSVQRCKSQLLWVTPQSLHRKKTLSNFLRFVAKTTSPHDKTILSDSVFEPVFLPASNFTQTLRNLETTK